MNRWFKVVYMVIAVIRLATVAWLEGRRGNTQPEKPTNNRPTE